MFTWFVCLLFHLFLLPYIGPGPVSAQQIMCMNISDGFHDINTFNVLMGYVTVSLYNDNSKNM